MSALNHLWLLAVNLLLRATAAATEDFGLYGIIQRAGTHISQWDSID
jgi:hypothetical protein